MSSRRKHVTHGLSQEIEAPKDGERIVRAVGSRGGNIVEVEYPDGIKTLCMLPQRFNKKLWIRRGGYLLIEEGQAVGGDNKVTGTINAVLYDDHIKELSRLPGVWPPEFPTKSSKAALEAETCMRLSEGSSDGEDGQQTPSTQPGQQERDAGGDASTSGNGGDAISDSKAGKGAGSQGVGGLGQASANGAALTCGTRAAGQQQEGHEGEGQSSSDPEDDLQPNMNRRVLVHQYSGSDDSDEE